MAAGKQAGKRYASDASAAMGACLGLKSMNSRNRAFVKCGELYCRLYCPNYSPYSHYSLLPFSPRRLLPSLSLRQLPSSALSIFNLHSPLHCVHLALAVCPLALPSFPSPLCRSQTRVRLR